MNALLKMAGAALLVAGVSVPAVAVAQSTVTAPGGNTAGTYMDYMISAMYSISYLIADILYAILNPRIRVDGASR